MSTAKLLLALSILIVLSKLTKCKKIQVISDFSAENDKNFFAAVYPWLVSNVPKLKVKYFFKDGEPGAKRMCTVSVLKSPVEQAKFLQCQAEGKEDCNEEQIAKKKGYKKCMENYQSNMKAAAKAFGRYKVRSTPMIVSGLSKMTTENPMVLLKKMCQGYLFLRPPGCKKPSALIDTKNKESKSEPSKYNQYSDSVVSTIGEVNEFSKDIHSEFTGNKKPDDRIGSDDLEKVSNIENLQDQELQKKLLKKAIVGWKMWSNKRGESVGTESDEAQKNDEIKKKLLEKMAFGSKTLSKKKGESHSATKSDDANIVNDGDDSKSKDDEIYEKAQQSKKKDDDGEKSAEDDAKKSKDSGDESDDNAEKSDDNSKKSNKDDDDKKSDDGSEKSHNNNDIKSDKVDTEKLSIGGDKKSDASGGAIDPKKD